MSLYKTNTAILLSMLFAVSLAAEPVLHDHDHESGQEIIECQLCENESFKGLDLEEITSYKVSKSHNPLATDLFLLSDRSSFNSRAPPKI